MSNSESSTGPFSQIVDGFKIPGIFSAENFRSAVNYKPRPDDLFLVTYPKCGTTWTGNILMLIILKGQPLKSMTEMFTRSPFLEMAGAESVDGMVRPGPIKTHLPFHLTPYSKEAKYIYVTRNPKDCCVSFYHHILNLPGHNFSGTFDQFFELFLSGETDFGDYFDNLLSWYPHRNDSNVLFLTYEELQEDIDSAILKMASFIDDEKYAEPIRRDSSIMECIKKYCSFKEMKEFMTRSFEEMTKMSAEDMTKLDMSEHMKKSLTDVRKHFKSPEGCKKGPPGSQLVRKGVIGDWRNYFSEDQNKRLQKKFDERTKNTEIPDWFQKYM